MTEGEFRWSHPSSGGKAGFLIGPAFLLLAGWFLAGPNFMTLPLSPSQAIHEEYLKTTPRRSILGDPPTVNIDGFHRTCMDCHKLFPARDIPPDQLLQHRHIVLDHGINNRCRNCHDAADRNRLVLASGESISYGEVVKLCAKCHGPTYHDWEGGMHGRTNGYWNRSRGKPIRLTCIECHDPHTPRVPAMDSMTPLPRPNTLRLKRPEGHGQDFPEERDPLRRTLKHTREGMANPPKEE